MKSEFKKAIEEYQCPGCVSGCDIECFKKNDGGIGCGAHHAGTMAPGIGNFFLGMPTGFNRLGKNTEMKPYIFESWESFNRGYDKYNIPVWKHLNEFNHIIVRGMMPRRNEPFLHIILENCIDKINCCEISKEEMSEMD